MFHKINRFNRILKTRLKFREEEQIRLRDERNEEEGIVEKLSFLNTEKKTAYDNFSTVSDGAVMSTQEIWFHRQVVDVIEKDIKKESISLNAVRNKITETEIRLLEKHKDVKIMDKHIDNLVNSWNTETLHMEQQEIDDVASIRFTHKLQNGGAQ
ncbi:MAG: flagellar FliJ family protein [Synergistaceae bacterium]|nr:flagellar FliJ family protein [Synergistaceae bacterium]